MGWSNPPSGMRHVMPRPDTELRTTSSTRDSLIQTHELQSPASCSFQPVVTRQTTTKHVIEPPRQRKGPKAQHTPVYLVKLPIPRLYQRVWRATNWPNPHAHLRHVKLCSDTSRRTTSLTRDSSTQTHELQCSARCSHQPVTTRQTTIEHVIEPPLQRKEPRAQQTPSYLLAVLISGCLISTRRSTTSVLTHRVPSNQRQIPTRHLSSRTRARWCAGCVTTSTPRSVLCLPRRLWRPPRPDWVGDLHVPLVLQMLAVPC